MAAIYGGSHVTPELSTLVSLLVPVAAATAVRLQLRVSPDLLPSLALKAPPPLLDNMPQLFDGCNVCMSAAMRGLGQQTAAATANLGAYYLMGLPLAYYLAFSQNWGVVGLATGLLAGAALQTAAVAAWLLLLDWPEQARAAAARLAAAGGKAPLPPLVSAAECPEAGLIAEAP